ncbi:mycothiol synthase [Nostocoides australiense]|nr:mycothiol synthase [Tetrasphaera australiensis]
MPPHPLPAPTPVVALTPEDQAAVRALARAAQEADGIRPLGERFLLGLDEADPASPHLLMRAEGGEPTAYGRVLDGAGELFVAPVARRQGIGTRLLAALAEQGTPAVWAHGDLPRTRAFARANGWRRVRLLHKMSRPLLPDDDAEIALPQGFSLRSFTPGDEDAWLAVNGRAFADHPEQGRVSRTDLDRLLAQPWFDPAGLLLLVDDATGDLAGSHWTKVDPQERAPGTDGRATAAGEVYVVAVDPAYHGRGLAVPLTAAGLAHLARRGLRAVVLYVDGDNDRALRTYRRLGFTDLEVHAQYRRVPAAAKMEP